MAVDTKNKRMSVIGLALPMPSMLPDSDGTIGVSDRLHLLWLYSGIAATPPSVIVTPYCRTYIVPSENRTYTPSAESRVLEVKC